MKICFHKYKEVEVTYYNPQIVKCGDEASYPYERTYIDGFDKKTYKILKCEKCGKEKEVK